MARAPEELVVDSSCDAGRHPVCKLYSGADFGVDVHGGVNDAMHLWMRSCAPKDMTVHPGEAVDAILLVDLVDECQDVGAVLICVPGQPVEGASPVLMVGRSMLPCAPICPGDVYRRSPSRKESASPSGSGPRIPEPMSPG